MKQYKCSRLALSITELLELPCKNSDIGCPMILTKSLLIHHEAKECRYRELKCPGCKGKISELNLAEHFIDCESFDKRFDERFEVKLNENQNSIIHLELDNTPIFKPLLYKLENSENWFILDYCLVNDERFVFYTRHFCGGKKKEHFNFKLRISGENEEFSRSMIGRCTPLEMQLEKAIKEGFYTLEIEERILKKMNMECSGDEDEDEDENKDRYRIKVEFRQSSTSD